MGTQKGAWLIREFPVDAVTHWNATKQALTERFRIIGGFEWAGQVIGGEVRSVFLCSDDPMITTAACNGADYHNNTGLFALDEAWKANRPITRGRTSMAEAVALSTGPSSKAPPPPPPSPKPGKKPALRRASPAPVQMVAPLLLVRHTIQAQPGHEVHLANGYTLAARATRDDLRWVVEDSTGKALRTFPAGSSAVTDPDGHIRVAWGEGETDLGEVRKGRLGLPTR